MTENDFYRNWDCRLNNPKPKERGGWIGAIIGLLAGIITMVVVL
jgi:hypothetical protein